MDKFAQLKNNGRIKIAIGIAVASLVLLYLKDESSNVGIDKSVAAGLSPTFTSLITNANVIQPSYKGIIHRSRPIN